MGRHLLQLQKVSPFFFFFFGKPLRKCFKSNQVVLKCFWFFLNGGGHKNNNLWDKHLFVMTVQDMALK